MTAIMSWTGCGKSPQDSVATQTPTAVEEQLAPGAYAVPDGSAAELLEYINQMALRSPKGESEDAQTDDLAQIMLARIRAADKIRTGNEANSYGAIADRTKLESMRVLASIGRAGARDEYREYADQLAASSDNETARVGRYGQFFVQLDKLMVDPNADPSKITAAIGKLLADEPHDFELFGVANEAANTLASVGYRDEAFVASESIGKAFDNHEDPELARQAADLLSRSKLMGIERSFEQIIQGVAGAKDDLLTQSEKILTGDANPASVGLIMDVSQRLENALQLDLAKTMYNRLGEAVGDLSAEDEMVQLVSDGVERAQTRMGLPGKAVELSGKTALGKDFDWSEFEDKVVLIDFWATWCGPCLEEIPNIRENYDRFHEQGFEVVGVNLDDDRAVAEVFIEQQELPWPTIVADADQPNDNAETMGVETIPFMVLVGRDGRVIDIHVRGARLGTLLAEQFDVGNADEEMEIEIGDIDEEEASDDGETGDIDLEVNEEGEAESEEQPDERSAGLDSSRAYLVAFAQIDTPDTESESTNNLSDEEQAANPYAPELELTAKELANFILEMDEKTSSIQFRDGFREGVCIAADRLLEQDCAARLRTIAAETKLKFLHRDACLGDIDADRQLENSVAQLAKEEAEPIVSLVEFFRLERKAVNSAAREEWDEATFDELVTYLSERDADLGPKHLRTASSLVEIANAHSDATVREKHLDRLGKVLLSSSDKAVMRYGKQIGKKSEQGKSEQIGKAFQLTGTTIDGEEFSNDDVKGQVVIVDFWATWCAPCRAAMPQMKALYDKYRENGLEIVGVSLDHDADALGEFLDENELPWIHLQGEECAAAAEQFGIHGIPSILLVDRVGNVVAQGRMASDVSETLAELMKQP